ncbi:hypothetical protein NFI96_023200, partial [Prochilodus magdalenae]
TVITACWRSLTATCCCRRETVTVKLSVPETSPSLVSTQPWDLHEPCLHHCYDFIRAIPVYPWTDMQINIDRQAFID